MVNLRILRLARVDPGDRLVPTFLWRGRVGGLLLLALLLVYLLYVVFQLIIDRLPAEFPALKTDFTRLRTLVLREEVRLVTLTGPAGVGKTRLALQLGAELIECFSDGVFFVPLAAVAEPEKVIPAILQALALREQGTSSPLDCLTAVLMDKQMLVLLEEGFQGPFAADGVAQEHRQKVDHLIPSEPPPCKAHPLADFTQPLVLAKVSGDQGDLAKPGRGYRDRFSRGLDTYRSIGDAAHRCLLEQTSTIPLSQRGTFLALLATG